MACTASSYTLAGTNLASFGFVPKSPIALSGIWDMPARLNKTNHNWIGDNYVEPYIREDEIFYGGRDIVLRGYIPYASMNDLGDSYYRLNQFMDGFTTEVHLANSVLGSYIVTVSGFEVVELCPTGYAEIAIRFRESEVQTWGNVPVTATGGYGINGYSWSDFGAHITSRSGVFNRGESKLLPTSVYNREARRVRTRNSYEGTLTLIFRASTLSALASNIGGLAQVVGSEGKKLLEIGDGLFRQVFVTNGFRTELLRHTSTQSVARVTLPLTEIDTSRQVVMFEWSEDATDEFIGDKHNESIGYIIN